MSAAQLPLAFHDTGDSRDTGGPAVGEGLPLVLGHGFALDHTLWSPQVAALAPHRRVLTYDAPGHGDSPVPGPFDYWDVADAVLAHLDALGLHRVVVGGLSQGGFIALRIALRDPQRVAGLILAATEAHACAPEDAAGYRRLIAHFGEHGTGPENTAGLAAQLLGHGPVARRWQEHWAERGLPLGEPANALIHRDDLVDRLGEITCPALLVCGGADDAIPPERMEHLRQRLPGAGPVRTVPGAAHAPPLTHPEEVTALLADWLAELD